MAYQIVLGNDDINVQECSLNNPDSLKIDTIDNLLIGNPKFHLYQRPFFISAKYSGGKLLGDIERLKVCYAQYTEMKVGISSQGNRWTDFAYGMPYYGVGVGFYGFGNPQIGNPISIYLLQGATINTPSRRYTVKYEWNLGTSFNWKKYNPVTNPDNVYVGAPMNIYFAANFFHIYELSKEIDLSAGITFNHVSNGATRMPNSGVNSLAASVGLTYHFNRDRIISEYNPSLHPPVYEEMRLISDFSFHSTVRQRKYSPEKTGLSSKYIDKKFMVAGASYSLLHMPDYKYRYGGSLDLIYDESAGFTAKKIGENPDGSDMAEFCEGNVIGRFALGLSGRGEIVMPRYSVSGQLGYDIIKGKKQDHRLYQVLSVRIPLWNNIYGSFILRVQKLSKAQYMFLGIGYMMDHKTVKRK
jgi:hypothetical protein